MCQILSSEVVPTFDDVGELPGVNNPDDGYEEGVEEEHHRFLLDYSIGLTVDIPIADSLHDQRHQGSGEEQTEGILESE